MRGESHQVSPRGEVGNNAKRRESRTEAEQGLANALLGLYKVYSPLTQVQIAKRLHRSPSAISQYVNLQRFAPVTFVKSFYEEALKISGDPSAMPIGLDELLALHDEAGRDGWSRRNGSFGGREHASLRDLEVLPVDSEGVNWQPSVDVVAWDGIDDVRSLLADARPEDAARLLDHAATWISAAELRSAVVSCRVLGFVDGAEALLRSASRRGDDFVLEVTREFVRAGQLEDIQTLLLGSETPAPVKSPKSAVSLNASAPSSAINQAMAGTGTMMRDVPGTSAESRPQSAGDGLSRCAGSAAAEDRRAVDLPGQHTGVRASGGHEAGRGCDASPVAIDPETGEFMCPFSGLSGEEHLSLVGESDGVSGRADEEGYVCADSAGHVHCSCCDRYYLSPRQMGQW